MDTFTKVKDIIVEAISCDEDKVTMEADIKADLGADSLDSVELVMAFEDAFEVSVPAEDAERLATVGDIVTLIDSLL